MHINFRYKKSNFIKPESNNITLSFNITNHRTESLSNIINENIYENIYENNVNYGNYVDIKSYENMDLTLFKNNLKNYIKKIYIITNKYLINECETYKLLFLKYKVKCVIKQLWEQPVPLEIINEVKNNDDTIIFIVGLLNIQNGFNLHNIQNKILIFQTEQQQILGHEKNKQYFIPLKQFDNIIEFSNRNNILQRKLDYMGPLISSNYNKVKKDIDILFFGSRSERRFKVISYLKNTNKYNIKIVFNVFGQQLKNLISRSKIILNIHFIENSSFEIFRINLALSCQTVIITELPTSKNEHYLFDLYKELVNFVPLLNSTNKYKILSNIIDQILNQNNLNYKPNQINKINRINKINENVLFKNLSNMKSNKNLEKKTY